jgi:hypothetical protein
MAAIDPLNEPVNLVDHTRAMRLALAVMDDEPDRFNAVVAEANRDGTTHALITALTRNLVLSSVARFPRSHPAGQWPRTGDGQ